MKEKFLHLVSYFHWYDIVLMSAFLMIALCFIFLSFIFFRRKIVSIPLFLLGFGLIIALPFLSRYILEERFYKISIDEIYNKVYNYSDVYQYIGEITNTGKRNIAGCVFSHQILYDTSKDSGFIKYKHMLLNYVKPHHIYSKDIPMDLKVGQSIKISQVMENYKHRNEPYITKIECYGKGRHGANDKVLIGYVKPPKVENTESSEESNIESSTDSKVETAIESKVESELDSKVETNTTPNTPINTESSQESNTESNTTTQSTPIPQSQPQSQDESPNNTESTDIESMPQESEEEARIRKRQERDNFSVPLLKETPR